MLTMTGFDADLRVYRAVDTDGTEYYIDTDEVEENRQHAEATGEYATAEAAWDDADANWEPDMDGVTPVADWPAGPDLLTRAEAARLLGVSKTQVQRLIDRGALPVVPMEVPGLRRAEVERYARERRPRGRPGKGPGA